MASNLIRRIARSRRVTKGKRIPGHRFESAIVLYLQGHWSQNTIKNKLDLTTQEVTELDWFKTEYDSRNNVGKLKYLQDVTAAVIGINHGLLNQLRFREVCDLPAYTDTTTTTSSTTSSTSTTTTTVPPT